MRAKTPFKKKHRRVGRGPGSGRGKTCARGHKGAGQRAGWKRRWGYEGGQNPYYRRFPKRGFIRAIKTIYDVVNLDTLARLDEKKVTLDVLKANGLLHNRCDGVKVLARGKLAKPLVVEAHAFSKAALEQIKKAGGEAITITQRN